MTSPRTTLLAALIAAGLASGAVAQSTAPATSGSSPTKPAAGTTAPPPAATPSPPPAATPSPPAAGSTGIDKGAGTGASSSAAATKTGATTSLSASERRFVEKAAIGGMAEVEMSKMAVDKAQSQQVKDYAKRLVDDHTKANAELMQIAKSKGVTPPAAIDSAHKRAMDKMAKRSANDFDRAYIAEMIDDHQKDIRDFRSMSKSAKDADLKAFTTKTVPVLEQHLQLAKTTEAAVKNAPRDRRASATNGTGTTAGSGTGSATAPATKGTTATPGKDTAATTGTAGPGTGMPTSSTQATGSAPQPPGSASDQRMNTQPAKK
ncbi:MAG TPA: DUF4142 domain-containing protein [Casimicrobiaceae bacterium]|nr:DUF4142 domain-containing protein [Casimicrobiaceae bacterium]